MKLEPTFTAKETIDRLEICDKTLRLWVQSGKLRPVKGTGGQGRAHTFYATDVEAFKRRRSGFADADLLARVAYGYAHPVKTWDDGYRLVFADFWKWHREGRQDWIETITRTAFPPLADVPPKVKAWAQRLADCLRPAAMDFVVAMFAARMNPRKSKSDNVCVPVINKIWKNHTALIDKIEKKEKKLQKKQDEILPTKEEAEFISRMGLKDAQNVDYLCLSRRINHDLYERIDEGPRESRTFLDAVRLGDREYVLTKAKQYENDIEWESVNKTLRSFKHAKTYAGRGSVRPGSVAMVLGIHRYQAMRLWKEIKSKVGRDGIVQLAKMLQLQDDLKLPKSWKATRRPHADNRPKCPGCGAKIPVTAQTCPICGRLIDTECPGCGEKVSAMAEKCPKCSRML